MQFVCGLFAVRENTVFLLRRKLERHVKRRETSGTCTKGETSLWQDVGERYFFGKVDEVTPPLICVFCVRVFCAWTHYAARTLKLKKRNGLRVASLWNRRERRKELVVRCR